MACAAVTRSAARRAEREALDGKLQDLVRAAQVVHLATELSDLFPLLTGQQIAALTAVGLRLAHALAKRLVVNTEISSHLRDRPPGLEHQPHAALHQLIGVLPRSWHQPQFLSGGPKTSFQDLPQTRPGSSTRWSTCNRIASRSKPRTGRRRESRRGPSSGQQGSRPRRSPERSARPPTPRSTAPAGWSSSRISRCRATRRCSRSATWFASAIHTGQPQALPGIAPVAMQQGRYAGRLIANRLAGRPTPPFHHRNNGTLATIGRAHAVADIAGLRLSGRLALFIWLLVHLGYLVGFENRMLVLLRWSYSFITHGRGTRLITKAAGTAPTQNQPAHQGKHPQCSAQPTTRRPARPFRQCVSAVRLRQEAPTQESHSKRRAVTPTTAHLALALQR